MNEQELTELYERSKDDNAVFVGSEIRQLIGLIHRCTEKIEALAGGERQAIDQIPQGWLDSRAILGRVTSFGDPFWGEVFWDDDPSVKSWCLRDRRNLCDCECDQFMPLPQPPATASVDSGTCPICRHACHGSGTCYNMASDNDCNCKGVKQ